MLSGRASIIPCPKRCSAMPTFVVLFCPYPVRLYCAAMNIFIPALILGIYTMLFFFYLGFTRRNAVLNRDIDPGYYSTFSGGEEPKRLQVLSRHAANLLEMPMLFYAVVLMIHVSASTSSLFVVLAWAFVGLRFVHAFVHLGSNFVLHRFLVFALSVAVLLTMWVLLLIRFLLA